LTDELYNQTLTTFSHIDKLLSDPISPQSARSKRRSIQYLSGVCCGKYQKHFCPHYQGAYGPKRKGW
jgi:hypothetical protein